MKTAQRTRPEGLTGLGIPLDLEPMEAKLVSELPKDAGWQYEPKWDGFRCLAFHAGDEVEIKGQIRKIALALLSRSAAKPAGPRRKDLRARR